MKQLALIVLVLSFTGCASIPVSRTYSLNFGEGKRVVALGVRFDPPAR